MVVLMMILTIVVFIVVDLLSRTALQRYREAQERKAREEALDIGLKLDYTEEAASLKRVEVDNPKAWILAVDDEAIVLDSFRRILVIGGYSVDTVETGPEALGLIRTHDYDFVFTDLKMPGMDGLDVVKAVKHLRPDIDVIMITGYATIESAVDAMKYGAMDYVQKPFTADELIDFVDKSLIRRQDRIEQQMRPKVHLITPSTSATTAQHEFNVPAGVFIAPTHTWASIAKNGMLMLGVDDFALKLIGQIDGVELPETGQRVDKGDPLFSLRQGARTITFPSPVSGTVKHVNNRVHETPAFVMRKPYELGWLCGIEPSDLSAELDDLRVGADAVAWYQAEVDKYFEAMRAVHEEVQGADGNGADDSEPSDDEKWEAFSKAFLHA